MIKRNSALAYHSYNKLPDFSLGLLWHREDYEVDHTGALV